MKAEQEQFKVVSVPTMCLHCHLIVELERGDIAGGDATWVCPKCAHIYPAKHWKIRVARNTRVVA